MHLVSFGASDREINMGTREARVARCSWDERERKTRSDVGSVSPKPLERRRKREGEREESWRE